MKGGINISILLTTIKIFMFLSIFIVIYLLLDRIRNINLKLKIEQGINKLTEEEMIEKWKLIYTKRYYISTKKISLLEKYISFLRTLIAKSNINCKFKFINPSIIIVVSIFCAVVTSNIAFNIIQVFPAALIISTVGYMIPQIILSRLAEHNSTLIDKALIDYINLLINFCNIKDDIVFSIKNAIPYTREPLRSYSEQFIYEVTHGIVPFDALENFRNKVSNKQFKSLLKNLKLCNKYSGAYLKVLNESKDLYLKTYKQYLNHKKELQKSRSNLYLLIALSIIIIVLLLDVNPQLILELRTTRLGKLLVVYNTVVLVITFFITIKTSKFEF